MNDGNKGFTLTELVLALGISAVVLVTVIFLSTNAVRYQSESVLRNKASSGALYSLARMRKELEDATYIQTVSGDGVGGCHNWSASMGAPFTGAAVDSFYYCFNAVDNQMYRYVEPGCNTSFSKSCGSGGGETVVSNPTNGGPGVYRNGGSPVFVTTGDKGVDIHYVVGYPGQKANQPVPADYVFDIHVHTNNSYNNTNE